MLLVCPLGSSALMNVSKSTTFEAKDLASQIRGAGFSFIHLSGLGDWLARTCPTPEEQRKKKHSGYINVNPSPINPLALFHEAMTLAISRL